MRHHTANTRVELPITVVTLADGLEGEQRYILKLRPHVHDGLLEAVKLHAAVVHIHLVHFVSNDCQLMLLGHLNQLLDVGSGDDLAGRVAWGDDCQCSYAQPVLTGL